MKNRKYSRFYRYNARMIAVAVIAAILLTATAVAAVIGGNALKEKLSASGAEDFASQVQDIHTQDEAEGFGLSIDEAVWEGENLFVSYTVTVPNEGGPWLVGLYTPRMNGEMMDHNEGTFFDTSDSPQAEVMGGEYATKKTQISKMILDEDWKAADAQNLEMRAVFMKANRPFRELPEDYDDLIHTVETIDGRETLVFNDSAYLMLESAMNDNGNAYVNLEWLPEVQMIFEDNLKKFISETGFDPEECRYEFSFTQEGFWAMDDRWDKVFEAYTLTAEGFESTGLVDVVCERSVTTQLDIDGVQEIVYNDVSEPFRQMDGYSIEVDEFKLSHLQYQMEIIIRKDGGFTDKDAERYTQGRYHDIEKLFYFTLMTPDGSALLPEDTAYINMVTELNGERVARVRVENEGIIDLENLDQLMMVPYTGYWGNGFYATYHKDEAFAITPIITEEVVDPNAVWCTLNGTYYHSEQYCMGMMAAQETTAEEAEKLGKKSCPECR